MIPVEKVGRGRAARLIESSPDKIATVLCSGQGDVEKTAVFGKAFSFSKQLVDLSVGRTKIKDRLIVRGFIVKMECFTFNL
jgi:hypothetical protein